MGSGKRRISAVGSKAFLRIFSIFIVIGLLIAAFSMQYYNRLSDTFQQESRGYLQEVSRRIASNVERIVNDNFAVLHTMATFLEEWNTDSLAQARQVLKKQQIYWNYTNIMLIDRDGKAYDLESELFLSLDDTVRRDVLTGKSAMTTTQVINNQECILFSVPLSGVALEGRSMVALAASYDPSSFDQTLSMSSFNERAYSQIVTTDGAAVIRPTSPYAIKTGYNIFSTLQQVPMDDGSSIDVVRDDVHDGRSGQICFRMEEEHLYMVYTPVPTQQWCLLTFVPTQVVNANSDLLLRSTLVICALIAVAFAGLVAALLSLFNRNKRRLEQIAFVDEVTGGNTIQRFYQLATQTLNSAGGTRYALVYSNMEKFKVLNEQLGRAACDTLLQFFHGYIVSALSARECIGRLSADNFVLLLEFTDEKSLLERFSSWHIDAERLVLAEKYPWALPPVELGVYVIENTTLTFPQMIDRAKLALKESAQTIDQKLRCAFYDDAVRRQLFREKQLEDRMAKALADGEFQVYLQPKYLLPAEKIGGAEALIRWQSPDEGMIFPDEFIPLFEKNGFIVAVDHFVFETVCRTLRRWIDEGVTPMKVSVNCSRRHFKDPHFLAPYLRIATQYAIPPELIEIELTESMVLENSERLLHIIDEIKAAGFGCSMDDFGSGYSSLNLIQTIPVDTLKLDKIFFQSCGVDSDRTEAVVGNIVSMARALSMDTVAEGVEHREQVDMLRRVGCDYIQGYVFARPMKIQDFEVLAFGKERT